jgi:hypothetical protein
LNCPALNDLGPTVSTDDSYTIGPNISVAGSPPDGMVILRLQGNSGPDGNLICTAGEKDVPLGPLRLTDYPTGFNPLSQAGFDTFTPPLSQLAGPPPPGGGDPVALPDDQVVFQVNPPFDSLVTLQLRPALTDADRRYEITIEAEENIAKLAFGLISTAGVTQEDVEFGGCGDSEVIGGMPAGFSETMRGCPLDPPDVGSRVKTPTAFSGSSPLIATYSVGPTAAEAGRLGDTLYVGLEGIAESLNNQGSAVLGVVEFTEPTPAPLITFEGADTLPGFETGAIQPPAGGTPISTDYVTLINTFSSDEDTDNDGVGDSFDNCVLTPNGGPGGQADSGGVGFVVDEEHLPDGIGDACTCGDPGFDGIVDDGSVTAGDLEQDDVLICQQLLSGQEVVDPADAERCQVTPGEGSFGIVDVVVLELETANEDAGTGDPLTGSLQACSAADAPL